MANRKKSISPLDQAKKQDLRRLFDSMSDTWQGGVLEMTKEGVSWIEVRLDERGISGRKTASRLTMCYNESGIPLVHVRSDGQNNGVYVSPVASAVIAIILR